MNSVVVAVIGFVSFFCASLPKFTLRKPLVASRPIMAQYLGDFVFMTVQTNFIGALYFLVCILASLGIISSEKVGRFAPTMFALGVFCTTAYYGLYHFDPGYQVNMIMDETEYPWVRVGAHLEHGLDLGAVALHAICSVDNTPSIKDSIRFTGGYFLFYVTLINVNFLATDEWVYPFFEEAYKVNGFPAVLTIQAFLAGFAICLALLGHYIMTTSRKAQSHVSLMLIIVAIFYGMLIDFITRTGKAQQVWQVQVRAFLKDLEQQSH